MVYKRVSSALFFSIVWMLLVCPKAYSQSNSMRVARIFSDNMVDICTGLGVGRFRSNSPNQHE